MGIPGGPPPDPVQIPAAFGSRAVPSACKKEKALCRPGSVPASAPDPLPLAIFLFCWFVPFFLLIGSWLLYGKIKAGPAAVKRAGLAA